MKTAIALAVVTLSGAALGCSSSKASKSPTANTGSAVADAPVPKGGIDLPSSCDNDGKTGDARQTDVDGDNRPEVVKYYGESGGKTSLLRQDIDLNWDGKIDVCRNFGGDGMATKEQVDLDYDGRIDEVRHYEGGTISRSERDRNNDGRADVIRRYKGGKLVQKDVDTNDDGQPDRWEYYEGDKLERVGIDLDHDGKVDRWSKAGG